MSDSGLTGNRLLDALPEAARRSLLAHSKHETVKARALLFHQGESIPAVQFPLSAVLSLVRLMEDGSGVEVFIVGNEGMTGLLSVVDEGLAMNECVCQIAGEILTVPSRDLRDAFMKIPSVQAMCIGHAGFMLEQIGQNVACSRLHSAEQRSARWLLMAHDRVAKDRFRLTQDVLAVMLGIRRASVGDALDKLKRAKAIETGRGTVRILDRRRLERIACECYAVMRLHVDNAGPPPGLHGT